MLPTGFRIELSSTTRTIVVDNNDSTTESQMFFLNIISKKSYPLGLVVLWLNMVLIQLKHMKKGY